MFYNFRNQAGRQQHQQGMTVESINKSWPIYKRD